MFDASVASKVGSVIHRLIAVAVRDGLSADQTDELLACWWRVAPLGGTTAWQTRNRAALAAAVYLRRLRPNGWELLDAEMQLEGAVADLVFGRFEDGTLADVFIDEVKTGRRVFDQPELVGQIARLEAGGSSRWPGLFRGVRVADLSHASKVGFWASDGVRLGPATGPAMRCGEERS